MDDQNEISINIPKKDEKDELNVNKEGPTRTLHLLLGIYMLNKIQEKCEGCKIQGM